MPKKKIVLKNIYNHKVELESIKILNGPREMFRQALENLPYRGYEVENIFDGRKIVITKPGGKFVFGRVKREDFMVWIYNPKSDSLWLISHKNILEDLKQKGAVDNLATIKIIKALEKVYNGEEPENMLAQEELSNPVGEPPEVLLKAYKWIWGQEDVNYPDGKGRAMSWEGLTKNTKGEWEKTGDGIQDLFIKLQEDLGSSTT